MKLKLGKKFGDVEVKPLSVGKKVISTAASYGAGLIVMAIIQKHLPEGMKIHTRLMVALGAWAIANMAKEQVSAYTDKSFDEGVEFLEKLKEGVTDLRDEIRAAKTA
jgi:hypothetical protein